MWSQQKRRQPERRVELCAKKHRDAEGDHGYVELHWWDRKAKGCQRQRSLQGQGAPDGSATYEVEGEYQLPK